MKRVIYVKNVYGTTNKYVLQEEYCGFGIYEQKTPSGYLVSQSWLLSNNKEAELVIESYNDLCKKELLDMIDYYNNTNKFGVKAVMICDSLHMHNNGKLMV